MLFPKAYTESGTKKLSIVGTMVADAEPAIEVERTPELVDERLDIGWLPFAAKTYHISPRIEDYILKTMPICPSDLPNRNGIQFPISELVRFMPPPVARQSYKAWAGCPVHLEHDNEDCTKALGVVLDAFLSPMKGPGLGKHYNVMGLIAIDKTKYPEIARKVQTNEINTGSMGALADCFTCSVCGHRAVENQFMNCSHINSTKQVNWKIVHDEGQQKVACLNAHFLSPIEFSVVTDPAWASSLSDHVFTW